MILEALQTAAKSLTLDDTVDVEPVIDRDTQGSAGSPDIAATIFSKIAKCEAFVADITIVFTAEGRSFPNSNVLVELGYAVGVLGWERVILVANTAYGPVESLPFDLRSRRILPYQCAKNDAVKAPVRKSLSGALGEALRRVASLPPRERTKLTAAFPDIRVKTAIAEVMISPGDWRSFVCVIVQNHSPVPVFLTGIKVQTDGWWSFHFPRNPVTETPQGEGRLEPGQASQALIDPTELMSAAASRASQLRYVIATDQIGREFIGDEQELLIALDHFKPR